jgi:hypothetical protein
MTVESQSDEAVAFKSQFDGMMVFPKTRAVRIYWLIAFLRKTAYSQHHPFFRGVQIAGKLETKCEEIDIWYGRTFA